MNGVSINQYHSLRVGSSLLSIVAGCIIIGVSRECEADAVGGIFLGAGGLGMLISIYPFIRAWLNINRFIPNFGNPRVHPTGVPANPAPEQPAETLQREGTLNQERSKSRMDSRMGMFVEAGAVAKASTDEGTSSDVPDILSKRKSKQQPSDADLP